MAKKLLVYMDTFSFLRDDIDFSVVDIKFYEHTNKFQFNVYYSFSGNEGIGYYEERTAEKKCNKENYINWIKEFTILAKENEHCSLFQTNIDVNVYSLKFINWDNLPKIGVISPKNSLSKTTIRNCHFYDSNLKFKKAGFTLYLQTYHSSKLPFGVDISLYNVDNTIPDEYLSVIFGHVRSKFLEFVEAKREYDMYTEIMDEETRLLYETITT